MDSGVSVRLCTSQRNSATSHINCTTNPELLAAFPELSVLLAASQAGGASCG